MAQYRIDFLNTAYEGRDLTGRLGYEVRLRRPRAVTLYLDHSLAADALADLRTAAAIAAVSALDPDRDSLEIRLIGAGQMQGQLLNNRIAAYAAGAWTVEDVTALLESAALQDAQLYHPDRQYSVTSAFYAPMTLDAVQYLGWQLTSAPANDFIHLVLQYGAQIGDVGPVTAPTGESLTGAQREAVRARNRRSVLLLGPVAADVRAYADALAGVGAGDVRLAGSEDQAAAAMPTLLATTPGTLATAWTTEGITADGTVYSVELDDDDFAGPIEVIWTVREDGVLYPPAVSAFTAEPAEVPHNGAATLSWTTQGATSILLTRSDNIEVIGEQPTSGSVVLEGLTRHGEDTQLTVTLTASNDAGDTVETVTIEIGAASDLLPPNLAVTVAPESVAVEESDAGVVVQVPVGTTAQANWTAALSDEVTLTPGGPQTVANRRAEGRIRITGATVGDTESYVLTATSRNGQSASLTITLETVAEEEEGDPEELLPGLFSYVTLDEAAALFAFRLGADVWTSASEDLRKRALVTATRALNRQRYKGLKTAADQRHAWPRTGVSTFEGTVPSTTIPAAITEACCEEALARLTLLAYESQIAERNSRLIMGIKREKIGDAETEYFDPKNDAGGTSPMGQRPDPLNEPTLQSAIARELLAPYVLRAAGRVIL